MKKTKFNKKEITIFKSVIKDTIKEHQEQLRSLNSLLKDHKGYKSRDKSDNDHDASVVRNGEMLQSMKARTKSKIKSLNNALDRIKSGTYGICSKTGRMISKQRLLALPDATYRIKLRQMKK